jgi:type IV pilus assembly protein PilP
MRQLTAVCVPALILVTACGGGGGSAAASQAPKMAPKASAETKAAGPIVEVPYNYDPVGKRDPFRSPAEDMVLASSTDAPCNEPLCQWDLDQLTLVAIVTGDANPIGMVEDPQGRGYIIRRNTKIGRRGGKVTQIMRGSVTIAELWTQNDGKVTTNPKTLALKADKQSQPEIDLNTGTQF